MIFFVISGKKVFLFSRKYDIFSLDRKWKLIFIKKYMEIWYFLYICINVANMILPFCQKNKHNLVPKKSTLKGDISSSLKKMKFILENMVFLLKYHIEWHSRKNSNDSVYFYGDLSRRFYILLSSKTKPENLTYRNEIWLLLQLYG